jgi:hypothetical protein
MMLTRVWPINLIRTMSLRMKGRLLNKETTSNWKLMKRRCIRRELRQGKREDLIVSYRI